MIADWTSYRYPHHRARILVSLFLGVVGVLASIATIYAAPIEGVSHLSCGLQALDCSKALTSEYSNVAGVPLGVFGVFYFCFWTLNLQAFQATSNDGYRCFLSWITLGGACVSLALGVIMFFILRAPCGFCLVTHLCNFGSFVLLWPVRQWRMNTPFTQEQVRHFVALTFIALLASLCLHFASEVRTLRAQAESLQRTIW